MSSIQLTEEERQRYGVYADHPAFAQGFHDYGRRILDLGGGVEQQAYDRGQEAAMRRGRR